MEQGYFKDTDVTTLAHITKDIHVPSTTRYRDVRSSAGHNGNSQTDLHKRMTLRTVYSTNDVAEIRLLCNLCALEPCLLQEMCAVK